MKSPDADADAGAGDSRDAGPGPAQTEPAPTPGTAPPAEPAPTPGTEPAPGAGVPGARAGGPLLPEQSREDTDAAWGEYPESASDHLSRDRPPHWDDF